MTAPGLHPPRLMSLPVSTSSRAKVDAPAHTNRTSTVPPGRNLEDMVSRVEPSPLRESSRTPRTCFSWEFGLGSTRSGNAAIGTEDGEGICGAPSVLLPTPAGRGRPRPAGVAQPEITVPTARAATPTVSRVTDLVLVGATTRLLVVPKRGLVVRQLPGSRPLDDPLARAVVGAVGPRRRIAVTTSVQVPDTPGRRHRPLRALGYILCHSLLDRRAHLLLRARDEHALGGSDRTSDGGRQLRALRQSDRQRFVGSPFDGRSGVGIDVRRGAEGIALVRRAHGVRRPTSEGDDTRRG